jgi:glycyl-tRNA synthetase
VAVPGGAAWLPPTHVGGYGVGSGRGKAGLRIDTRAGASDSPPSHFMAEPKENVLMEKIVSLCKRRGFVFQSSEIYGGINGFWDYGPLGAELKRNVKELWWNSMTRLRDDVVGLEATIIMAPQIWRASGHVDTFSDPMCDCLLTGKRFRADQIEAQTGTVFSYQGAIGNMGTPIPPATNTFEASPVHEALQNWWKGSPGAKLGPLVVGEIAKELLAIWRGRPESQRPLDMTELSAVSSVSNFLEQAIKVEFSVLLPAGKPPESARKVAKEFYAKRGLDNPLLLGEVVVKAENTTRFNPENGAQLTDPRPFNLMLQTWVGPIQSDDNVAYLRPETAQAIFAQFKNVHETSRQKLPFGIAQVGKAFRNEVTPRNFTFRSREFEQMELEFFIKPDEAVEAIHGSVAVPTAPGHPGEPQPNWGWQMWHQYWVEERVRFYEGIGLSRATLGFHYQTPEELAHYARATTDILFKFPFSKADAAGNVAGDELEGIAARSDFDLSQHERHSGKSMGVFDEDLRTAWGKLAPEKQTELAQRYFNARLKYLTKSGVPEEKATVEAKEDADGLAKGQYIPHVIEPSAGVDRLILALIANAFSETTSTDEKGKSEVRTVMKFHPRVAPVKVGVYPLLKNKPELVAKAKEVFQLLRGHMLALYDETGSVGKRYARQDEAGTPFGVTIDFDTLGEKPELLNTVTVRHRDDGAQERVPIGELLAWLQARVK